MPTNYSLGDIVSFKPVKNGNSYYFLLSSELMEYLDYDAEKDLLVMKFEKGKWGPFLGIGKKRI